MENGKGIPIYYSRDIAVLQLNGKLQTNSMERIVYDTKSHNRKRNHSYEAFHFWDQLTYNYLLEMPISWLNQKLILC